MKFKEALILDYLKQLHFDLSYDKRTQELVDIILCDIKEIFDKDADTLVKERFSIIKND